MKERPILFSGDMVRALLDGRKTQTRRIVKLPHNNPLGQWEPTSIGGPNGGRTAAGDTVPLQGAIWHTRTGDSLMCPYGQPGDRLYVRETWAAYWGPPALGARVVTDAAVRQSDGSIAHASAAEPLSVRYAADMDGEAPFGRKWKPSIHMPRWASRITLEVTGVRVERLQDISENDAVAEGIRQHGEKCGWVNECQLSDGKRHFDSSAYGMYRQLWDDLNAARGYGWDANPWVWMIEFRRIAA